jgi:hypothetical protein
MSQILSKTAVIGIDIGKNSFHVGGLDADGAIVLRQVVARSGRSTAGQYAALPDWHGGLCRCASPQPQAQGAWPRRPADAGEVCAAVLEGAEERLSRR